MRARDRGSVRCISDSVRQPRAHVMRVRLTLSAGGRPRLLRMRHLPRARPLRALRGRSA